MVDKSFFPDVLYVIDRWDDGFRLENTSSSREGLVLHLP